MDVDPIAPPVSDAPPPDAPVSEEASVAEHEAQFGKGATAPAPEDGETDATPARHRAKSQRATAADVPRIHELTRKLREAEAEIQRFKTSPPIAPAAPMEAPRAAARVDENTATAEKPSWKSYEEQIGTKFETWGQAQDAYNDDRDAWKEAQFAQTRHEEQRSHAQTAVIEKFVGHVQAFSATTKDYFEKVQAVAPIIDAPDFPPLLKNALLTDDNGPELLYHLATHPVALDEMILLSDGKSVTDASVALLRRRLSHYRVPAVNTGSVAASSRPIAPRPPNPVRTGPLKTGDELPGDDASILEHEKAFGPKARRR